MRWCGILAVAGLAALLGQAPTQAADASVFSQYQAARQIFLGNAVDQQSYSEGYAKLLFNGIEGNWAPLRGNAAITDEGTIDAVCTAKPPTRISIVDAYTLLFSTPLADQQAPFEIRYSLRYGSLFGSFTDIAALTRQLGIAGPDNDRQRMTQLARLNGTASIWRVSPDILAIQEENGMPILWGRCPGK